MLKKIVLSLGFVFIVTLLLVGCPGPAPQPTPELGNATPNSLNFDLLVSQDSTNEFSFTNTGEAGLAYTLSESEDFLSLSRASGTLEPEETETITVTVTCSAEGDFSGTIDIDAGEAGSDSVLVTLTCEELPPVGDFNIELELVGSEFTPSRRAVFEAAAAKWATLVVSDLPDVTGIAKPEGFCNSDPTQFPDEPAFNGDIDDLYIAALIAPIDEAGGILGFAAPCIIRDDGGTQLPVYGIMVFDVEDIEALEGANLFDEVILHEMGHVLGIGTYWDAFGFLDYTNVDNNGDPSAASCLQSISSAAIDFVERPTFNGSQAVLEFAGLGGSGQPPVEDLEQRGTGCSHWDEETFDNELMTGFIDAETPGPLSLSGLTVTSLADLGYDTDLGAADDYEIPDCSPTCGSALRASGVQQEPWEFVFPPKGTVKPNGEIIPFNNPR
jgi:hypothetical protein